MGGLEHANRRAREQAKEQANRITQMVAKVFEAYDAFRARWSVAALERVNADLADRVRRQSQKWDTSVITGDLEEVERHGASMVKGWRRAVAVMVEHDAEHDAYMVGVDASTGLTVTIGEFKPSLSAFQETADGTPRAIHMTPDEVATMMAGLRLVSQVKAELGGEIVGYAEAS